MNSPFVKKLSIELGKPEEEINQIWVESKKLTAETFGITEEEFTQREILYTEEIVRDALGVHREITIADFINSEKSAREFIDEAVQSSDSFGIDKSVTKKKKNDEDEDDPEMMKIMKGRQQKSERMKLLRKSLEEDKNRKDEEVEEDKE